MKTFFLIACTLILSTTTFAQHDMKDMPGMKMQKGETKRPAAKNVSSTPSQKVIYTCLMHPEVKMDKPGNCLKCGMKLVKKTVNSAALKAIPKKQADMSMTIKDTSKKMEIGRAHV